MSNLGTCNTIRHYIHPRWRALDHNHPSPVHSYHVFQHVTTNPSTAHPQSYLEPSLGDTLDTAHPSLAPMGGFVRRSSRLDSDPSTSATAYRPRMTEPYEENEEERTAKAHCEAQRQLAQMYSVTDPSRMVNDDQTMQGKSAQTSPSGKVTSPQQRPRTVPPMFPQAADIFAIPVVPNDPPADTRKNRLSDLPIEIQEHIIDYLAGPLGSATSTSASRNWNHAMRHPRRRQLTQLALVSPAWREMIQGRVFRHRTFLAQTSFVNTY